MTAIGNYFRTALLIDDRAVDTAANLEPLRPIPADGEPTPGLVATSSEGIPLHWNSIVNAFLDEEVVCSVLRPDREDDIQDIAVRGSKITDLLILDWDLFDDDGEVTKETIKGIVRTNPRRLRVIVIYTEMPLHSVVDALADECGMTKESDFVFSKKATLVLIFSKSGKPMEGEEESNRTVDYSDLPKMIRKDLEIHFGGLVPELAFGGINIIRESTPRVLATFRSSLDVPLLTHRALLPEVSDVGPQFIRLLTGEFEAALMESSLTNLLDDDSISERLEQSDIVKAPQTLPEEFKNNSVEEALALGFTKSGLNDNRLNRLLAPLVEAFNVGSEPHESLAVLMCSTPFGYDLPKAAHLREEENIPPRLEAGVVLENEGEYWLCVQPLCDSVRISGSRKFPLVPLVVNVDETGSPKRGSEAMIRAADGTALPVSFSTKPYELLVTEFKPSRNEQQVLAQQEGNDWYFTTNQTRYRAVCRLRSEFTQQAVQKFTSGVARVGVDSSEWLRRSGRR